MGYTATPINTNEKGLITMLRVVVTGYGIVSPIGLTAQETWDSLLACRSGVAPLTLFDASDQDTKVAAEVKNFDPEKLLDRRAARRMDRKEMFANVAAREAIEHSGLEITDENRRRIGMSISSAFGGIGSMVEEISTLALEGHKAVNPLSLFKFMTTSPYVSIGYDLRGPSFSVASACATGGDSIGLSMQIIRAGRADVMVAGGADAMINLLMMSILTRMQAQSRRSEATPSPFSATRDGLVSGEGAGVLVLESLEHAKKRGANILAELAGYGATTDAFHLTAPREDASETARAMTMAMEDAGLNPEDVDYVNTHGTGTVLNDPAETLAIKLALGQHAYEIPVSATKSMTGHIMGATAAMEAIFSIQTIRSGVVPPTINYTEPDPDCDLDYVPNAPREMPVRVVLSNSFGFGGHNAVLALRAFEG